MRVKIFGDGKKKEETVGVEWCGGILVQVGWGAASASLSDSSFDISLGCWEVVFLSLKLGSSCFCSLGYNSGNSATLFSY